MSDIDSLVTAPEASPCVRVGLHLVRPLHDAEGRLVDFVVEHLNPTALGFLGLDAHTPPGTRVGELVSPGRLEAFLEEGERALKSGEAQFSEFEITAPDGGRHWMWHEVIPLGEVLAVRSVTAADRYAQAEFDELTGLLNDHGLRLRGQTFIESVPEDRSAVLVRLAPRRFHDFRDVFGFEFADALLRAYAERLVSLLAGHRHLAARMGQHQFAVLMELEGEVDGDRINGLAGIVDTRLEAAGLELHIVSALGVARLRQHGRHVDELLRAADMAYSESRRTRSRQITFYNPRLGRLAQTRITLQKELAGAIARDELRLVFQPILAGCGEVEGFEALLRWHNAELGEVSPAEFIPVAEETGLILELGRWVFGQAAAALAHLRRTHGSKLFMSINISAAQFSDVHLADQLSAAAVAADVPTDAIELEITETVLMHDTGESELQIQRLRGLGFRLSVDDFGTGYSSLAYLRRFLVDKLKVDRSFVAGLEVDRSSIDIVRAIVSLAASLNLPVVAEGVETRAQLDLLRGIGCDQFQGFFLGRPSSLAALDEQRAARPGNASEAIDALV
ncbi:putative bifunctional diguanylate cyclase/phosphodiesterase [Alkalisalibacterium limincola]|uniref:Sensor domain-containing phosphodiesterase n=1 Tax=Alkalisalibacterium limincola TaxID=2699169 RepID=A0A5C8KWN4_9GAMM|nr:sensor domain-containing phosphodiesterase [Alkalisalibacterium limincola]TXK65620.1 sensor domain-containing phosphodiesterase [Alkalisalibacterium limincola]